MEVNNVFTVPVTLKAYRRLADGAVSLRTESRYELTSGDIASVDGLLGGVGIMVLTDEQVNDLNEKQVKEILENLPENDLQDVKSPSKRLRNVLWVWLREKTGKKPTQEEFVKFYQEEVEKVIDHYKNELNNY